jgi:hypothetical protein
MTVNDWLHDSLYCPSETASVALWGDRVTKFDVDECMERGKEGPIVILLCAVMETSGVNYQHGL